MEMDDLVKKISNYRTSLDIPKVLGNLLLVAMVLILASRAVSYAAGDEAITPVSVVSSGSMEPVMHRGDVIMWTPTPIESINEGDIVVFRSSARDGEVISHRVIEVRERDGRTELITQGDANEYPDQEGPHYPERPITSNNLLGRVVSIGDLPMRIPLIGHLWLGTNQYIGAALANMGGGGLLMLVPLLTAGMMILGTILMLPEKDDDEEGKLKHLILGDDDDKIHPLKVFIILVLAFSLVIIVPSMNSMEEHSISVGVQQEADPAQEQFSRVRPGQTIYGNHSMTNYGVMSTRVYIYSESEQGWMELGEDYTSIDSADSMRVPFSITVPEDTERGTYSFQIKNHYSPFWALYPDGFVTNILEDDPERGALTMDILTVLIFSSLSMGVMIVASLAYDEIVLWKEYYKAKRERIKNKRSRLKDIYIRYTDWLRGVDIVDFDLLPCLKAASVSLIAFPIALLWPDLWLLLLTVPLSAALAYLLGCRWRAEHYTTALIASGITVGAVYMVPLLRAVDPMGQISVLLIGLAIMMIILVMLSPLVLLFSYLTSKSIHSMSESKRPTSHMSDL